MVNSELRLTIHHSLLTTHNKGYVGINSRSQVRQIVD
jgi:hypothetical protein